MTRGWGREEQKQKRTPGRALAWTPIRVFGSRGAELVTEVGQQVPHNTRV